MDGKGLVYQGRSETGAAAVVDNPNVNLREIATRVNLHSRATKAALEKGVQDLSKIEIGDWDAPTQQELVRDRNKYIEETAQAYRSGANPRDIASDVGIESVRKLNSLKEKIDRHKTQKEAYVKAVMAFQKENEEAVKSGRDPIYDIEKTLTNLKSYLEAPSIDARSEMDPTQLLVLKETPFNPYDIYNELKPETTSTSTSTPTGGSSNQSTFISSFRANNYFDTPVGKKAYERGLKSGLWADKAGAVRWAIENNPNKSKSTTSVKAPKGGGSKEEIIAEIGEPTTGGTMSFVGTSPKTGTPIGKKFDAEFVYKYQTPNINVVAPNASLKTAAGRSAGSGVTTIKDGLMAVVLMDNNGNVIPINSKTISYTDPATKKKYTANNPTELRKKIVGGGSGAYDVLLIGNNADGQQVYGLAKDILTGSGEKNLGEAEKRKLILQEKADELNFGTLNDDSSTTDDWDILNAK